MPGGLYLGNPRTTRSVGPGNCISWQKCLWKRLLWLLNTLTVMWPSSEALGLHPFPQGHRCAVTLGY